MGSDRPSAPLLAAKQAIPILRGGTIHRDRLESQLRTADTPLTLVVAPAGWGKTTLLSSWARGDPEVRVAWVSLDENDDEPMRFWRYVLSALQASSDAISPAPLEALLTPGLGPLDLAVPLLLNELAATTVPHAIVLDDFHLLENRSRARGGGVPARLPSAAGPPDRRQPAGPTAADRPSAGPWPADRTARRRPALRARRGRGDGHRTRRRRHRPVRGHLGVDPNRGLGGRPAARRAGAADAHARPE